jgi:hypothetical protein
MLDIDIQLKRTRAAGISEPNSAFVSLLRNSAAHAACCTTKQQALALEYGRELTSLSASKLADE